MLEPYTQSSNSQPRTFNNLGEGIFRLVQLAHDYVPPGAMVACLTSVVCMCQATYVRCTEQMQLLLLRLRISSLHRVDVAPSRAHPSSRSFIAMSPHHLIVVHVLKKPTKANRAYVSVEDTRSRYLSCRALLPDK